MHLCIPSAPGLLLQYNLSLNVEVPSLSRKFPRDIHTIEVTFRVLELHESPCAFEKRSIDQKQPLETAEKKQLFLFFHYAALLSFDTRVVGDRIIRSNFFVFIYARLSVPVCVLFIRK